MSGFHTQNAKKYNILGNFCIPNYLLQRQTWKCRYFSWLKNKLFLLIFLPTSDWEFYCANWEKGGVSPLGVGPNFAPQNGLKRNTDAEMVWIDWCFTSR